MGSAPAPHLAIAWLSQFENIIKGDSSIYFRYMDDVMCGVREDLVQSKLDRINNLHPSLTFTVETEQVA